MDVASFPMPWTVFEGGIAALGRYGLYNIEGQEHKERHKLLVEFFNPMRNKTLRPSVERLVAESFERVKGRGPVDFYTEIALRIPSYMAMDFLGLPGDDDTMAVVKLGIQRLLRYVETLGDDPQALRDLMDVHAQLAVLWGPAIEERRRQPRADVVSSLVALERERADCAPNEIVAQCLFLFTASLSNTANAISNAVYLYLSEARWSAALEARPETIATFVDETMRVWSAVQFRVRMAASDMVIAGQPVKKGQRVFVVVGAANRDGHKFPNPTVFDLERKDAAQHLTFGRGARFCAGAPLARMEIEEVVRTLASSSYQVRLLDPAVKFGGLNYRARAPLMV